MLLVDNILEKGFVAESCNEGNLYVFQTSDNDLVKRILRIFDITWDIYADGEQPVILIHVDLTLNTSKLIIDDSNEEYLISFEDVLEVISII